jgi:ubiquinone/menaquinone biosynthesis C-methylase UbiE
MMRRVLRWGLRTAFRLLYNELAWTYDGVSWLVSWGEWRSWQRTALPHLRGPRVLELGFGTGDLLFDLAGRHHQVYGVELSSQMVRITQRKLRRRGLILPLVRGRGQALSFSSNTFDSVVVTFPSPFIVHPHTLTEIHRVLRPRGRLVMVPQAYPHRWSLVGWVWDSLYTATGQRASRSWKDVVDPVGLCAVVHEMELHSSVVQVVVAVNENGTT